ncbi:Uma2 family endonuclease, partial [Dolichospermum sp. LEGE 00246]|nr:Uma2 family endonuclease [Dolichospermum sp. LEGE 00246]
YRPITPNAQGWLWSEALGFFLGIHNGQLRYFSLEGAIIPTPQESAKDEMLKANQAIQIAKQESQRAEQESQRAEQESQRAEQESQRAEQESQRAEQESQRAEQESQRAEQESQRAEQANTELYELKQKMRSLGISLD